MDIDSTKIEKEAESYYEKLMTTYNDFFRIRNFGRQKGKLGDKINSVITLIFLLTFSQILPLFIYNQLIPEKQSFQILNFPINAIIFINIGLLLLLKLLHSLNKEHLIYSYWKDTKKTPLSYLQKSFMALMSAEKNIQTYELTKDKKQLLEALEHFKIFESDIPYEILYSEHLTLSENAISRTFNGESIPWFILTDEQIKNVLSIKKFCTNTEKALKKALYLKEVSNCISILGWSYYLCIQKRAETSFCFTIFQDINNLIPEIEDKEKNKVQAWIQAIEKNYVLYFLSVFFIWLTIMVLFVYLPCRIFFQIAFKELATLIFSSSVMLAAMDANKNVKDSKPKE